MFLKEKFDADGKFEKIKARLAAGGNLQDKSLLYESLSSPTVSMEAVIIMMVIAIAAIEKRQMRSYDIVGAYLESL